MANTKGIKWNSLQHNGPVFPPEYEYVGFKIKVANKPIILNPDAEEVAYFWAQKHNTDYITDPVAIKNFWKDFKRYLPIELKETIFPTDWNFTSMINHVENKKLETKSRTKEERNELKEQKNIIKSEYGTAILNGDEIALGNYVIEPPGLFMGRGDHPNRFRLKKRIKPEDVIINHSMDIPAPKPPKGHSWKQVIENKEALFTAAWVEPNLHNGKRILFANDSIIKQNSDKSKFDRVSKLAGNVDLVKRKIKTKLKNTDYKTRKIATVATIISELAIRVGNEKGEDSAKTFGATTLLCKHIKINGNNVSFNFLGKDSVPYINTVKFSPLFVENLTSIMLNKKPNDAIFDGISSGDINRFFNSILPGISAKDFRTAYGSLLLAGALSSKDISTMTLNQKMQFYTDANLSVAKKLNHHSAVSPQYEAQLSKLIDTEKIYKKQLRKAKREFSAEKSKLIKTKTDKIAQIKEKSPKNKTERIKKARVAYTNKLAKLEKGITRFELMYETISIKVKTKKDTKGIALGTSKTNYSDPRINYSFCNDNNIPIQKVYTPTLQKRFEWAKDVNNTFYKNYPNV